MFNIKSYFASKPSIGKRKKHSFKPFMLEEIRSNNCDKLSARSGHRIVFDDDNKLYCWGGYNPNLSSGQPVFEELWQFDMETLKWTLLPNDGDKPPFTVSHTLHYIGNQTLLMYGGTSFSFGEILSNQIYLYDLRQKRWSLVQAKARSPDEMPLALYGQGNYWDEKERAFYSIGGTDGFFYSSDVHRFDERTCTWEKLASSAQVEGRYRHCVFKYNNCLYSFGGGTNVSNLFEIEYFDLQTLSWHKKKANWKGVRPSHIGERRNFQSCVMYKNFIYVIGGQDSIKFCLSVLRYDLDTNEWSSVCEIKQNTHFHSAAVSPDGQVVSFGGIVTKRAGMSLGMVTSRTNELFSFWVDVPPLKEIAWKCIRSALSFNQLGMRSELQLLETGFPPNFVRRIRT